ncbi:multidrug efflux system translocase MdfA family protein [Enterobacter hormaechei subsp. xiangfangensis]|nr:multidrug efflux system translocase MdfA family protein [Enterobacter hormaechei subsp. xiangfangensis]
MRCRSRPRLGEKLSLKELGRDYKAVLKGWGALSACRCWRRCSPVK